MALTKVEADGINLADTFAFSGTVTGAGVSSATSTLPSEGGSATTIVAQGWAKFWCHTTTSTSADAFNQSSITDSGVGYYTHNFSNNMNNDAYAGSTVGTSGDHVVSGTHSTSAVRFDHFNQSNSNVDCDTDSIVHGDLA